MAARAPGTAEGAGPAAGADGAEAGVPGLLLGSGSPRRRALLAQVGVVPDAVASADIDETPRAGELPRAYAARMAREKGEALAAAPPAAARDGALLILTADTVVSAGRRILGKPADADEAARFLRLLSGRRHRVITAVALRRPDGTSARIVETRVKVKRLSADEMAAYLRSGEWQGKAGGYAIQGIGAAFVPEIIGSYTNVVGLPLTETVNLLVGAGYPVHYDGEPA